LSLDEILSHTAVERFARIDARLHRQSGKYTAGFHLADYFGLERRLAVESRLGSLVDGSVILIPRELRPTITSEAMTAFLSDAARDARVRRILVL
jgi:hypothetical protein